MLGEKLPVSADDRASQFGPRKYEEAVSSSIVAKDHEYELQTRIWLGLQLAEHLTIAIKLDVNESLDIELPVAAVDGLYLNGKMTALLSRGDYVVVGDVSREWGGDEVSPTELGGNEELSDGTRELCSTTGSHSIYLLTPNGPNSADHTRLGWGSAGMRC